jgi:mannose-6-phosphate isomerase-like protein (cupin superfamily)
MKHVFMLLILMAPLGASDPAGFALWKANDLKGYKKTLAPRIDDTKFASQPLGAFGNHTMQVSHREGNGPFEMHQAQADLIIVQTGEATLVVGGKIPDGKTTAPNEVRGSSIQGGERKKIGPGDVVHIPANTPHQLRVDNGKQFTYVVMKINSN